MKRTAAFFYVSGHGFGHAVRQIEIMNALAATSPRVRIFVRTTAPPWLFERTARFTYTLLPGPTDTGVVQRDSLTLDEKETIRLASTFYDGLDERVTAEAALLKQHGGAIVVSDAPPLACAAASAVGVPSFVVANFTWDWIYAAYSPPRTLLATIQIAYSRATAGWRLPMHGGFETVQPLVDVPFVVRRAHADLRRDDVRRMLGLPIGARLALISFGGYGIEGLDLAGLDCSPEWRIVTTGRSNSAGQNRRGRVVDIDESAMYAAGLRYEDVVRAVDVVVTKPGYGIISDCIAGRTAMLYTSRGRFAEYDVLVSEMPRYLRCRFIEMEDLRAGRWSEALQELLGQPEPREEPRTDGATVIAGLIAAVI